MRGVIPTNDSLITAPAREPLSLDEVKLQRRVTGTSLDSLFRLWIAATRRLFEKQTGIQLITATWELWLDAFPAQTMIELPHPPLQSVTSVKYDDADGVEQTFSSASYTVVAPTGDCARGRIVLKSGYTWPSTIAQAQSVRIRYVAGYGATPASVPEHAKAALMMLIGVFHRFGEEVQEGALMTLPVGAKAILDDFKHTAREVVLPKASLWD